MFRLGSWWLPPLRASAWHRSLRIPHRLPLATSPARLDLGQPSSLLVAIYAHQGLRSDRSTLYLTLKPAGELQRSTFGTPVLAAATTLGGALLITVTHPSCRSRLRERLFDPSFLPFLWCCLSWALPDRAAVLPQLGDGAGELWPFVYTFCCLSLALLALE